MAASSLNDFPDRLSPMLVKELRQGLRARSFIAVFLSLQIFLGLVLLSASASASSDRTGSVISGIIFLFFSLAVLVVQPLRGVGSLSSEIKGGTIDMMVLTRLSASRIIFGKWIAIVGQSALLLSTIVPYLILRYFFGGMNLFAEIVLLGLIFITSMALTAVTVGLSGSSSVVLRSIIPLMGTPVLIWTVFMLAFSDRQFGSLIELCTMESFEARVTVVTYLASIIYLAWSMMSLGASLIAPAAENHSTLRRLIALALMGLVAILCLTIDMAQGAVPLFIMIIATPAIATALTESAPLVPTVCVPFVRRGPLGSLTGRFLMPGWPAGVFFSLLLLAIGLLSLGYQDSKATSLFEPEIWIVTLSLFGGLLLPGVLVIFFRAGESQRVANYLLLLIALGVSATVLTGIAEAMSNRSFLWLFIWNPFVFLPMMNMSRFDNDGLLAGIIIVDGILAAALAARALVAMRAQAPVLQQAREILELSPLPPTPTRNSPAITEGE
jgi:hypothetical protein